MSAGWVLLTASVAPLAARLITLRRRRALRRGLQQAAQSWRLCYAAEDRFRLAARLADRIEGRDLAASDLVYGQREGMHCCLCLVERTLASRGRTRRERRVALVREEAGGALRLDLAPPQGSLLEQFRRLHDEALSDARCAEAQPIAPTVRGAAIAPA